MEVARLQRTRARENSLGQVRGSPLTIYQAAGGTDRHTTKIKGKKVSQLKRNVPSLLAALSTPPLTHKNIRLANSKRPVHVEIGRKAMWTFSWDQLCGWGRPWTAWFSAMTGSESRTSCLLGKHSTNLSYPLDHQHRLPGMQRQEAAKCPICLPLSSCALSQGKIIHVWSKLSTESNSMIYRLDMGSLY